VSTQAIDAAERPDRAVLTPQFLLWARALGAVVALAFAWPSQGKADAVVTDCTPQALAIALVQGGQVTFTQACTITLNQAIPIIKPATLDASGFAVTISGGNQVQLFNVATGITNFTLTGLTLTGGQATNGGAVYINPQATVMLNNCIFTTNSAAGPNGIAGTNGANHQDYHDGGDGTSATSGSSAMGGAVFNLGTLTAQGCLFSTNSATGGTGGTGGSGGYGGIGGPITNRLAVGGDGGNGGAGGNAWGGAIYNLGSLTLSNCTFSGNSLTGGNAGAGGTGGAGGFGPGLDGVGASGGSAFGAGVYSSTTNVVIVNCTFATNTAQAGNSTGGGTLSNGEGADGVRGPDGSGGGVCSFGASALTNCTFYGNTVVAGGAGNGGNGTGTLSNAGNGGNGGDGNGGGFFSQTTNGTNYVVNCTFANGGATGATNGVAGSGPFPGDDGKMGRSRGGNLANGGGSLWLVNSVVATNTSGTNGYVVITDGGRNVSSDASLSLTTNSLSNTDPRLGALADNGGPTLTMALLVGSRAIDFADCGPAPTFDQRGQPRPTGSACDSGAFELGWTLSGTVTSGANGLAGILITATNAQATNVTWSVSTDESGNYILPLLPGFYSITPSSPDHTFSPSQVQTAVTTNTTADFAASTKVFTLAGQVVFGGSGLGGVVVTAAGPTTTNVATTSANGSYLVTGLPEGNYVITPSRACYHFTNATATVYVQSDTNITAFSGALDSYTVNGQIIEGGTPMAGVSLSLGTRITQTDTNGQYVFTAVCGGTYTVTPVKDCFLFNPPSRSVTLGPDATSVNFVGYGNDVFSIRGQITTQGTTGLGGVTVSAGGYSSTTDANGNYVLSRVCPGVYTVVPSAPGVGFSPPSKSVSVSSADVSGVNFSAYQAFSISGLITDGSNGLAGVTVTASGLAAVTTDAKGSYTITNVPAGTNSVVPSLNCYLFQPPFVSVTVGPGSTNLVNFTGTHDVHSVSGQISEAGVGLSNVTVHVGTQFANTDSNGVYTVSGLCPGTYTILPARDCYLFNPPSRTVSLGPDSSGLDFVAYQNGQNKFAISGSVTEGTNALEGVTVQLSSASASQTVQTDSSGNYSFPGLCAGSYTISPAPSGGYFFVPTNLSASFSSDTNGLNFSAWVYMTITNEGNGRFLISTPISNGYSYRLEAATNLVISGTSIWLSLATNLATPFEFHDTNTLNVPMRFYRINR
jgi:hypothetical protein